MVSKFKVSVEINLPANKVFELFLEKKYFKEWKKDYTGFEHISGARGKVGAVTKLIYKRQAMIETIVAEVVPSEIIAEYEHQQGGRTNMWNRVSNRFTLVSGNRTFLEVEMEITKVEGLLLKLIMKLMAGAGKKYAQIQLDQFKVFAENLK